MSRLEVAIITSLGGNRRYFTGEELARMCGVIPQEIGKAVAELVARGYRIETVPGEGYRLMEALAMLDGSDLHDRLSGTVIGHEVYSFGRVGSTNDVATALARGGASEGCLVVAEEQTKGRGRLGRTWYSPPSSGLWFSIVFRPNLPPDASTTVSLAAALGVATALEDDYAIPARIKWPNDVVVNARKICGILTEAEFTGADLNFVVVGIGINVLGVKADFPLEIRDIATSLRIETGGELDRAEVLAAVIGKIEKAYVRLREVGFPGIKRDMLGKSSFVGKAIQVHTPSGIIEGTAADVDDQGALLLRGSDGSLQRILVGDVTGVG
jgi:BirA family biotin operon repressor/biotin-[acetyl-CoA-carboxylase] ligase